MMNRKLVMFSTSILAAAMLLACTPKKEAKPTDGATAAAGTTAPAG